jgi:predicted RNA binding protein YcfA (HicA-like mRNA interferase family)
VARPDPRNPPRVVSHDSMKALLLAAGWNAGVGGKHSTKMQLAGHRPITLPRHSGKDYGPDLRNRILQQAGLKPTPEDDDIDDSGNDDR